MVFSPPKRFRRPRFCVTVALHGFARGWARGFVAMTSATGARRRISVLAAALLASVGWVAPADVRAADPSSGDAYMVVDCLLPGQVRKLGRTATFITPRRPIRTSGMNCEIRGG